MVNENLEKHEFAQSMSFEMKDLLEISIFCFFEFMGKHLNI